MTEERQHEELDAYQRSMRFLKLIEPLLAELPSSRHAVENLDRASSLIPLHIAKGASSDLQNTEPFEMAVEAALECSTSLDVLAAQDLIEKDIQSRGKEMLQEVIKHLRDHRAGPADHQNDQTPNPCTGRVVKFVTPSVPPSVPPSGSHRIV